MNELKEQIYDTVEKKYNQRVWITRMQEQLSRVFNTEVPIELIREIIDEIKYNKNIQEDTWKSIDTIQSKQKEREDGGLKDMVKKVWDAKHYDYIPETDHIVFYIEDKPYPVLRTTAEAMVESFSKRGKNWSWKKMMIEFQLTPKVWNHIKYVLNIYKDSSPFDPVTLSKFTSTEQMEQSAKEKAERLTEAKMVNIFDKQVENKLRLDTKAMAIAKRWYDIFMEKFEETLKRYNPVDMDKIKIPNIKNNDTKDIFITDAHIGKKWTDGIVVRFKKLTRDLIATPEKNINITFGWDLGELFVPYGEMHPWQRLWMEEIETSDLIMLIVDVFEQMLVSLMKAWKTVEFNGMKGNHDRFTEHKEFDPNRQPALLVYKFLQRILENTTIKINILNEKANIIKSGKIKYVFIHWDWLGQAELNRRALAETEDWFYLVIVSGDKHNYKMTEISDRVLRIQSPALAWAGKYDESLALTSLPWAIEFKENQDWLIDFTVKRYR